MACLSQTVSLPAALAWHKFCPSLSTRLFHCGRDTNPLIISKKALKATRPCKASLGLMTFSEHRTDTVRLYMCVCFSITYMQVYICVGRVHLLLCLCVCMDVCVCAQCVCPPRAGLPQSHNASYSAGSLD